MKQHLSILLVSLGLIWTNDEDVQKGNLSHGRSMDGRSGKIFGEDKMNTNKNRYEENVRVLKNAVERAAQNITLNENQKSKIEALINKAAQGNHSAIDKFFEKGIINKNELEQLEKSMFSKDKAHITEHFLTPDETKTVKKTIEEETIMSPKKEDVIKNNSSSQSKNIKPTNTALNDKKSHTMPQESFTLNTKPGTVNLNLDQKKADLAQKLYERELHDNVKKYAYEKSLENGLLPEEAEANAEAADAYITSYQEHLKTGMTPEDADRLARKTYKNKSIIAPNGEEMFEDIIIEKIKQEFYDETLPLGTLADQYSAHQLKKEAEIAEIQEQINLNNKKEAAQTVKKALEEDKEIKQKIQKNIDDVKEKLNEIKELEKLTIEEREAANNNKLPDLQDSHIKTEVEKRQAIYQELVNNVNETPKEQTFQELNLKSQEDKKQEDTLKRTYEEFIKTQTEEIEEENKKKEERKKELEKEESTYSPKTKTSDEVHQIINEVLTETTEQRAQEEAVFEEQVHAVVQTAGEKAYQNVINLHGTEEEAKAAQQDAIRLKEEQIKQEVETVVSEIIEIIEEQMDPETAKDVAHHIAKVHTTEKLSHLESPKSEETATTSQSNSNTTTTTEILTVLTDDAKKGTISNGVLKLPLPKDIEPTPKTSEDQQHLETLEEQREKYRNKTYRILDSSKPLHTGLPTIQNKDGTVTTYSEGLESMTVEEGIIQMTEETIMEMKEKGLDTSAFKPKITDNGTIYELPLENAIIELGNDGNRSGVKIKVEDEVIDIGRFPAEVEIKKGQANMQPFEEYRKLLRPEIHGNENPTLDDDNDPVETEQIEKFAEIEHEIAKEERTKLETYPTEEGSPAVTIIPGYGTSTSATLDEAKNKADRASKIDYDHILEEKTEEHVIFDMAEIKPEPADGVESFFDKISNKMQEPQNVSPIPFVVKMEDPIPSSNKIINEDSVQPFGSQTVTTTIQHEIMQSDPHNSKLVPKNTTKGQSSTGLNSNNPITNQVNPEVEQITQHIETIEEFITTHLLPETNLGNKVFNKLLKDVPNIVSKLGSSISPENLIKQLTTITPEKFEHVIHNITTGAPAETIKKTIQTIVETSFSPEIAPIINELVTETIYDTMQARNPNSTIISTVPINGNSVIKQNPNGSSSLIYGKPGSSTVLNTTYYDNVPTIIPNPQLNPKPFIVQGIENNNRQSPLSRPESQLPNLNSKPTNFISTNKTTTPTLLNNNQGVTPNNNNFVQQKLNQNLS